MQVCTSPCEQEQTSGANDRILHDNISSDAGHTHPAGKTHGCAKRGGRPVTWIGGGGLDAKKLAGLGVPVLRDLFKQVFGESTASNNAGWLRRKLSETPDGVHGQCRSRVVRARDSGAAIWNKPLIFGAGEGEFGDAGDAAAAAAEAEGQGEAGGVLQAPVAVKQEADAEMQEAAGAVPQGFGAAAEGCAKPGHHGHRSLKRSCTEASQSFRERVVAARCPSPSTSGSASPAATHQEGTSPRAGSHSHKQQHRHHHHTHKQHGHQHTQQHSSVQQQPCGSSLPGHVIHPDELADEWVGCQVMVYWPADNRWWAATICGLSTVSQQLQLLYSDQTEELLAGHDFCELLRNGHLALAAGHAPPPDSATGYTVSTQAGAAAAACGTSMLPSGACSLAPSGLAAPAYAAAAAATAEGLTRRVQSCHLPASLAGSGSMASQQELARSTSVSFGVKCGGSGVNFSGARVSQLQQAAQQAAAAAAAAGAGGCQGLMYGAGVQGLVGGGAAAACGGASQLAGNGFKVAQAPCESSFAHMFDFY
ncbi:hypothetical protein OEZ85_013028 [Tetradesmus obliquus]|uniref:PWWP domain-containing protein n=1 Tax=Tetradesmus obliquus TaxID=3088 RepID=A0ABY8U4F8_TETOB|nr:hypothetical protein OEZ85_013028 [Tetradesmus obliquus]